MSKKFLIPLILITIFVIAPAVSKAEVVDKVLAIVNDELITQSELDRILLPLYEQYKTMYNGDELLTKMDEARKDVLEHLISDKLILCDARKQGIEVKPEEIQQRIDDLKSKFSSEDEFNAVLLEEGITIKDLQKRFEDDLLKEKFIDMEVKRKVVITPTEINEYYNAHTDEFKMPQQAHVRNILIKVKENESKADAFSRAEKAMERLKAGEDFAEVVKSASDGAHAENGGDMGYVGKGQLRENLDNVVFSLEAGKISDIVEDELGYHIFMVIDRKDEVIISLEEVYDKIRDVIYRQKAKAKFEELVEELKKNAYISIK